MAYHLVGDSTVAACPPVERPMSGWGAHLAPFVDAPVDNRAVGGSTTEDCLREVWPGLLPEIAADDTVLIQFGHNDQKRPHLDARGGFAGRLRAMVADVRDRGARPVLCTSVERRWFDGDRVIPTHGDYPNAVRDLAHELDVPLIDLNAFTTWLYEDLGPDGSTALLCHFAAGQHPHWPKGVADDTHFHERGATRIAAFVARSLRAIERRDGDQPARGTQLVS